MCNSGEDLNALVCTNQPAHTDTPEIVISDNHNDSFISEFFPEILSEDSKSLDHDDSSASEIFSDNGHFESHKVSNNNEELDLNNDPFKILSDIRRKNLNRPIIGHININFLEGKFEALKHLVEDNLDVLVVTETKIDASYPTSQFAIKGVGTPFRQDRNKHGGGVLIYIREHLPCREIPFHNKPNDIEGIFVELSLRKKKWLIFGGYNPAKELASYFLDHVSKHLDVNMANFDNILIIGDFNSTMSDVPMKNFCELYDLDNLINVPTCFKNADNPSSIDVLLTNSENSFQNSIAIETGLSDHHKMVVTVLKIFIKKKDPVIINYRSYKNMDFSIFNNVLRQKLEQFNKETMSYEDFHEIFMNTLDIYAPMKKKIVRGNNAPFMTKALSKEIMHRSKLKNIFNKNPNDENKRLYKRQRNLCVSLLRKEKKNYYNNLDLKIFDDNRKFWKSIKPLFSDKQKILDKNIFILEDGIIYSKNEEVAEKLNNFFIDAVQNLEIEPFVSEEANYVFDGNIDEIIKQYETHPSIQNIKVNITLGEKFVFSDTIPEEISKRILDLEPKKASVENDIPAKILIGSHDVVSRYLSDIYNRSKHLSNYPGPLKLGTVTPINKKSTKTLLKKDYRPITLIPIISKLFEKDMYDQISSYMDKYFSPYLFGYRKNHSTEQCLTIMIEFWKKALDSKNIAGAVLTDLSKAFDCLNHNLLIAKLDAYGFDNISLKFIYEYLKERKQRTKVNNSYSTWKDVLFGVPQGSILGPLLFNIFMNDIFFFIKKTNIANYADDNTAYTSEHNVVSLLKTLEDEITIVLNWFRINEMKSNDDKCHLIIANTDKVSVSLGNEVIGASDTVELLGIKLDKNLNFNQHVSDLLKKGNQKLHALARISKYLSQDKLKIIMKTFIQSQFNYCPLIWMFHSRTLNNKINKLHERALRLVYKNENLCFQELLNLDNSVTIHQRNLQRLAVEMYKVKNNLSPLPMQELFTEQTNTYNLRNCRTWEIPNARTVSYGLESVRFRGPKTWELLPNDIKEAKSLAEFKIKIKTWKSPECTCRLCKTYIANLGFID